MAEYSDDLISEIIEGLKFIEGFFVRYNDFSTDKIAGLPVEICRHGNEFEPEEIVVLCRYPASFDEVEALTSYKRYQQIVFLKQKLGIK